MGYGLRFLFLVSVLMYVICFSFSFRFVAYHLNNDSFHSRGVNVDYSPFREHQSKCSVCSRCLESEDLNSRPCEEGFRIMFSCNDK